VLLPWLVWIFGGCTKATEADEKTSGKHPSGYFTGIALSIVSLYATIMSAQYLVGLTAAQTLLAEQVTAALACLAAITGILGWFFCG
jgi:hypothetical protein